ncbi:hypothetical protein EVAR_47281_1 [Eumeta japonica]|uniref:Uncharacterized protein n=1 Tax=Eumeta variegata TaxID=151549 RepID=A0A4C1Z2G4_EUMVA|nr:hypothetical protein EVAR_47281_1 [Eumeta japonica]
MAPQDVNSLTEIDSDSRMSPTVCKLTHRNRFWLEESPRKLTTGIERVYHKGACPTLQGEKINQALNTNRFWLEESPTGCKLTTGIDSGSRRSPIGCKLTHRNRFWLEEEPLGWRRHELILFTIAATITKLINRLTSAGRARDAKWAAPGLLDHEKLISMRLDT